jgi:hypothetical protein
VALGATERITVVALAMMTNQLKTARIGLVSYQITRTIFTFKNVTAALALG